MPNVVAVAGIVLIAAVLSVMLKKYHPEYSILISLMAGVVILYLVLSQIGPAVAQIRNLLSAAGLSSEYGVILLKALGVCFLTQFAADSCRDAGEAALAAKVELAGKLTIVLLSLPLFEEISQTALSLIGGSQ
jgi:stage III sporulation protein AD